jgi:hypothetical protein
MHSAKLSVKVDASSCSLCLCMYMCARRHQQHQKQLPQQEGVDLAGDSSTHPSKYETTPVAPTGRVKFAAETPLAAACTDEYTVGSSGHAASQTQQQQQQRRRRPSVQRSFSTVEPKANDDEANDVAAHPGGRSLISRFRVSSLQNLVASHDAAAGDLPGWRCTICSAS